MPHPTLNSEEPDWGEVDDHGDVFVAPAGVAPHVLVHADHLHAVEALGVIDEHPLALGQDGLVRGVPGDSESFGDPGNGEVLDDDAFQSPRKSAARELRSRLDRSGDVLSPHMPTASAFATNNGHRQRRRTPAPRLMRQLPDNAVTRRAFAAAPAAPEIRFEDPAGNNCPIRIETLTGDDEAELVESAESGQVGAIEGSVRHVELFRMDGVGAFIFRETSTSTLPPTRRRSRSPDYTPDCEEPVKIWRRKADVSITFVALFALLPTPVFALGLRAPSHSNR